MLRGSGNAAPHRAFSSLEIRMRFPQHLLKTSTLRAEPLLAAMAAIAVGMFVGTWILGPAITRNSPDTPAPAVKERTTFEDMVSRPDPFPYRAPTPTFDTAGQPSYAAAAKEKAQAQVGSGQVDPEAVAEDAPSYPVTSTRPTREFDRHRVY
jgi:hypothetical protein